MPIRLLLTALLLILLFQQVAICQERSSISKPHYSLLAENEPGTYRITLHGHANIGGEYSFRPNIPEAVQKSIMLVSDVPERKVRISAGEEFNVTWVVHCDIQGYVRMFETWYSILPDIPESRYTTSGVYSLFAEYDKGELYQYSILPLKKFSAEIDSVVACGMVSEEKSTNNIQTQGQNNILLHIKGQIQVATLRKESGTTVEGSFFRGVPNVFVALYWDMGHGRNIYGPDGKFHYVTTDLNGNFELTITVPRNYNLSAPLYRPFTVIALASTFNEACKDIDDHNWFAEELSRQVIIDVNSDNVEVQMGVVSVDPFQGNIVRGLTRARLFALNDLQVNHKRIYYEMDTEEDNNYFRHPNWWNPFDDDEPHIVFNNAPFVINSYHEYGHYVHWNQATRYNGDYPNGSCSSHDWDEVTNQFCAITEGWAEFFAAACYMYWLGEENPALRDPQRSASKGETDTHFPDVGERSIPDNNIGTNEGAVATFIYSLWDGIPYDNYGTGSQAQARTTGSSEPYFGDNEDLGSPCGYPGRLLVESMRDVDNYANYFASYSREVANRIRALYPSTMYYHGQSFDHLFYAMAIGTPEAKNPATATELHVAAYYPSALAIDQWRRLDWRDNTEPLYVKYLATDKQGSETIDLQENNEYGFLIYRKPLNFVNRRPGIAPYWCEKVYIVDGRIDPSYQLIAIVPANQTTYIDQEVVPAGEYSYVVVAHSDFGTAGPYSLPSAIPTSISIPKTSYVVTVQRRGIDIRYPVDWHDFNCAELEEIQPGSSIDIYIDIDKSEFADPTFTWLAENVPPFIGLSGTTSDTLSISSSWYSLYGLDSLQAFRVRCVVADTISSDTSAYYYPFVHPLDSLFYRPVLVDVSQGSNDTIPVSGGLYDYALYPEDGMDIIRPIALDTSTTRFGDTLKLSITGNAMGNLIIDSYSLYEMRYPEGGRVTGTPYCGYRVDMDSLITEAELLISCDSILQKRQFFAMTPWCFYEATHSTQGNVSEMLESNDGVVVNLTHLDTLSITFVRNGTCDTTLNAFDTLTYADSMELTWPSQIFQGMRGFFVPQQGSSGSIISSTDHSVHEESPVSDMSVTVAPNPSSGQAMLSYNNTIAGNVKIELLSSLGSQLGLLWDGWQDKGVCYMRLNLQDIANGTYFVRISANGQHKAYTTVTIQK